MMPPSKTTIIFFAVLLYTLSSAVALGIVTPAPTPATTPAAVPHGTCPYEEVLLDFATTPDGTVLAGGDYISAEWFAAYGITITASANDGGYTPGGKARLYDTSLPDGQDPGLGSPNVKCNPSGYGVGAGGEPGRLGENCLPQGNVLIIQDSRTDAPSYNDFGGEIKFCFKTPAFEVYSVGVMDIAGFGLADITVLKADNSVQDIGLNGYGENSVQDVLVNIRDVQCLTVNLELSGAVRYLMACLDVAAVPPTPEPTPEPSLGPTPEPSPEPTPGPTPAPTTASTSALPTPSGQTQTSFDYQTSCVSNDETKYNMCLELSFTSIRVNDAIPFTQAKEKWETVITGDLPSISGIDASSHTHVRCQMPQEIDDTYVCASDAPMDGPGGIVGGAGPHYIRALPGTLNPMTGTEYWVSVTGGMEFDEADLPNMIESGLLDDIALHEMGHILGLGTLWTFDEANQQGNGVHVSGSPNYAMGTNAQREWERLGCSGTLPVEQDGGPGTRDGHFDEECLQGELMTGAINAEHPPLSKITVGSLEDIGYSVNYDAADPYTIDDLNLLACGSHCPMPGINRRLRGRRAKKKWNGKKPQLSLEGRTAIKRFAANRLRQNREQERRRTTELPEGVVYVGGDFMSVLYLEEGQIYEETVTWEEVQDVED